MMIMSKASCAQKWSLLFVSLMLACSQQESASITDTNQEQEYSSEHFKFNLTRFDHANITTMAQHLENNYSRVASDLSATSLPIINVQFYSDQSALHQRLNFPNPPAWLVGAAT